MRFGFVWAFRSDGASVQILIDVIVIYHVYVPSHRFFELRTKVSYEDIFYFCGTAARDASGCQKGSVRRAASRLFKL